MNNSYVIRVVGQPATDGTMLSEQALMDMAAQSGGNLVYDHATGTLGGTFGMAFKVLEWEIVDGVRVVKRMQLISVSKNG